MEKYRKNQNITSLCEKQKVPETIKNPEVLRRNMKKKPITCFNENVGDQSNLNTDLRDCLASDCEQNIEILDLTKQKK